MAIQLDRESIDDKEYEIIKKDLIIKSLKEITRENELIVCDLYRSLRKTQRRSKIILIFVALSYGIVFLHNLAN